MRSEIFAALLLAGCQTEPTQPVMVAVREPQSGSLPLNVGPGGCLPVWQRVEVPSGQEPVCLLGKLESVTVVGPLHRGALLLVNCGCVP